MRALLRDKEDGTLFIIAVTDTSYNPDRLELYLYVGETCYTVHGITQVISDSLIRSLFENGKADFTQFQAGIER